MVILLTIKRRVTTTCIITFNLRGRRTLHFTCSYSVLFTLMWRNVSSIFTPMVIPQMPVKLQQNHNAHTSSNLANL